MKQRLLKAKNGQVFITLVLLLFVVGGCKMFGGDEGANANSNANAEKKIERKEYTLKNAKNSADLVNTMKSFTSAGSYIQAELINVEKVKDEKKLYDKSIAEARAKYTSSKNPIYIRISKFPSSSDGLLMLKDKEQFLKLQKLKPIKGEKDGITTLIWFDKDFNNFLQCKGDFCFEAFGSPDGKKLEDSFAPLTVISVFRDKI